MNLTEDEIIELVENLEYEINVPRSLRSLRLDYDEMKFILELIYAYRKVK